MDVLFVLDLIGTAVFAYSGALAARGHGYHILGILYIALLTAVGGGTVRYLLLQTPGLFWFESSAYAWVITSAVAASFFLKLRTNSVLFYLLDSFSLAVFISIGFTATLTHGHPVHIAFAMGVLSGIGGGLIRDAITSQPPQALSDPVYPFMIFSGSAGSLLAMYLDLPPWSLSVALVLTVAVISIFAREHLPAVVAEPPTNPVTTEPQHNLAQAPKLQRKYTVGRTFAKAITVLIIVLATSLYFFNPASNTAVAKNSTGPSTTAIEHQLNENITLARWQLENKNLNEATKAIDEASRVNPQHPLLNSLKKERNALKLYLQHIAEAESALEAEDLDALQLAMQMAAKYDRQGNKFTYLQGALNTRLGQLELEKKHRTLAASSVNLHITSAKQHLQNGNFDAAKLEVTMAESFGIKKDSLALLSANIDQKIAQSLITLSDNDVNYAESQLGKLQRAIELRNLTAIKKLTSKNPEKHDLFSKLFERYIEINVKLTQVTTFKKNVTATLEIESMRLPDGNFNYPPNTYGVIALNLILNENGWTRIQW